MTKPQRPRPICPECGSADVIVGDKTGTCNRCAEHFPTARAFDYPKGTGETTRKQKFLFED